MTAPATPTPAPTFCPRGCQDADDCKASIAIPCALNLGDTDDTGKFQPCGCLERERCRRCSFCENCEGCYCGED